MCSGSDRPAVRVALGEIWYEMGTIVKGKIIAALEDLALIRCLTPILLRT